MPGRIADEFHQNFGSHPILSKDRSLEALWRRHEQLEAEFRETTRLTLYELAQPIYDEPPHEAGNEMRRTDKRTVAAMSIIIAFVIVCLWIIYHSTR